MKKTWLGSLLVLVVVFVAGAATAQMDPGPFHILHKQGAIFNSDAGWTVSTPPYYPGTDWAVDFNYHSQGMSILHKDGCIWEQGTGWVYSGYYAGSNYAQALEYLRDVTGCWNYRNGNWEIWETGPGTIGGEHDYSDETIQYLEITDQVGTRIYGQRCEWEGFWECDPIEGTIIGDHVTIIDHDSDAECEWLTTVVGVVFWDETRGCWALKGSFTGTDFTCTPPDQGYESANFGSFEAWQGTPCPPVPE